MYDTYTHTVYLSELWYIFQVSVSLASYREALISMAMPSSHPKVKLETDPPVFGPPNPYLRRGFLNIYPAHHLSHPKPVDQWLQANMHGGALTSVLGTNDGHAFMGNTVYKHTVRCVVVMKYRPVSPHLDI